MGVVVRPSAFVLVDFDPAAIVSVVEDLCRRLDLGEAEVVVEVDEATPLARVVAVAGDPVVLHADSGALEDTRRPRQFSASSAAANLGRALLRVRDRRTAGFDAAPDDRNLPLPLAAAWQASCAGRLDRAGVPQARQRFLYDFRNRHGFTDAADRAFDAIWAADGLTLDALEALSTQAQTPQPATRRPAPSAPPPRVNS